MNAKPIIGFILTALLVSSCSSTSELDQSFDAPLKNSDQAMVDVSFYDISASSFSELDRQIALHGPFVSGVGKAIASTNVRMIPNVKFVQTGELCRVASAKVNVQAKITLPRLNKRKVAKNSELTSAFGNLESYAAKHEAVHVSIAENYARKAETQISSLAPKTNCKILEQDAVYSFKAVMAQHRRAQLKFDEDEKIRFNKNSKSARIYSKKTT